MTPDLPPNALLHLPTLVREYKEYWPDMPYPSALAGQVEQETCVSLRNKKCWSPYAELKTDREYGFGLGQLTVTSRFNNFEAARKLHPSLKSWTWEGRYNANYQLRTMVLMDRFNYNKISWTDLPYERLAMSLAAYNGGLGGLLSDKKACSVVAQCSITKWFGNIEGTSLKSKRAAKGYGKSFFEINREYVRNILKLRSEKYRGYME